MTKKPSTGVLVTVVFCLSFCGFYISYQTSPAFNKNQRMKSDYKYIVNNNLLQIASLSAKHSDSKTLLPFVTDDDPSLTTLLPETSTMLYKEMEDDNKKVINMERPEPKEAHNTTVIPQADNHRPLDNYSPYQFDADRRYQYWMSADSQLPYDPSLVTSQQLERHSRINKVCMSLPEKPMTAAEGHHSSIFIYKHLLYCPILKAGSTNILRLLCWLYGPPCNEIENLHPHNEVPQFLEKGTKVAVGNTDEFRSYFSFAIVRNPWRRLVSVYIQKFVETNQGLAFCKVKQRFPRVYSKLLQLGVPMTFSQYINLCVLGQLYEGGILEQNGHWRPQYQMCSFCSLDYTFIGKMETMKTDERVILNAFGFEDVDKTIQEANNKLLPNEKANKTTLLYEDLWNTINPETIDSLRNLYQTDIEMFDYPNHPLG